MGTSFRPRCSTISILQGDHYAGGRFRGNPGKHLRDAASYLSPASFCSARQESGNLKPHYRILNINSPLMLLRDKLSLIQVFRLTWRLDLMIILVCSLAYAADTYWPQTACFHPRYHERRARYRPCFFIGFNNNQAYDRWWEGRKIWGALVNDSPAAGPATCSNFVDTSVNGRIAAYRQEDDSSGTWLSLYALNTSLRKDSDTLSWQGYLSRR